MWWALALLLTWFSVAVVVGLTIARAINLAEREAQNDVENGLTESA